MVDFMKYHIKDFGNKQHILEKRWFRSLLIVGSVLVISYLLFMGTYLVVSQPKACGLCHDVKPYVDSWKSSPHKDVQCLYCHERRGFMGKLDSMQRGLNDLYVGLTHQYTVFREAKVFEENCISCHLGNYRKFRNTKKLDDKHYNFIIEKRSCNECHSQTGHKSRIFPKKKFDRLRER